MLEVRPGRTGVFVVALKMHANCHTVLWLQSSPQLLNWIKNYSIYIPRRTEADNGANGSPILFSMHNFCRFIRRSAQILNSKSILHANECVVIDFFHSSHISVIHTRCEFYIQKLRTEEGRQRNEWIAGGEKNLILLELHLCGCLLSNTRDESVCVCSFDQQVVDFRPRIK